MTLRMSALVALIASLAALPASLSAQDESVFDALEREIQENWDLPLNFSANFLGAAGSSTAKGEELEALQAGAHDPNKRGFNLQQFEIGAFGKTRLSKSSEATLAGYAYTIFGTESVELEEAFGVFSGLPWGMELEFGYFLTEFGLNNPQHPHAWAWPDQNFVLSRMLGSEGMRGLGFRLAFRSEEESETPWSFHLGMQDAFSETMLSFGGGAGHDHGDHDEEEEDSVIGGGPAVDRSIRSFSDFVYLNRGTLGFIASSSIDLELGYSFLYGPNRSGLDANTSIWGFDLRATFYGAGEGKEQVKVADLQAEVIGRNYKAAAFVDEGDPVDPLDDVTIGARTLKDYGLYLQGRYWLSPEWALGLRFEYADSDGQSFSHESESLESPDGDPLRDSRMRISPMLQWQPAKSLRLRAQYNYDDAKHLADSSASSVWFSLEYSFSTTSSTGH